MANKNLFSSAPRGKTPPPATGKTHHGTRAYKLTSKNALAQFAATGSFGSTFYVNEKTQVAEVLKICTEVEPEFIAKCAVYSRKFGFMKDAPAFLASYLAAYDVATLKKVFYTVIDNPKMLRNFVQILRSGVTGRKSLGTAPKKLVLGWINQRTNDQLFRGSVGNDPSMADVIKMVHPTPKDKAQEATLGYLIGKEAKERQFKSTKDDLPWLIKAFEHWKKDPTGQPVPPVPWEMLTAQELDTNAWKAIAENAGWQMTRMNLNTFERHGVFKDKKLVKLVSERLRNEQEIAKSRVFPYQLLMAYLNYDGSSEIKNALQDAMEVAIQNVPAIEGQVVVAVDISGSMAQAITGARGSATSKARCVDVAALFAACVLRKNQNALIMPFNGDVIGVKMNPRDSIMTNAERLARLCNNGTNCSAPLAMLNRNHASADAVIYFSDNESWMDHGSSYWGGNWHGFGPCGHMATETMKQWSEFKSRCKKAKMVCLDLTPNTTSQVKSDVDILNIGGLNDNVFMLISDFVKGNYGSDYWTDQIEKININGLDLERN